MKKLTEQKDIRVLVLLCAMVYFVSYLTRINYAAVLVEIIRSEGLIKTEAAVPLTALFITYGIGQLLSGYLGDRVAPEKLITGGLLMAGMMNLALLLSQNYVWMTVVWAVNGFAQALLWPPIVKLLTVYLTREEYKKKIVYVTYGSHLGTTMVYLMAPVLIRVSGWRAVFVLSAGLACLMVVVWNCRIYRLEARAMAVNCENRRKTDETEEKAEERTKEKRNTKTTPMPFSKTAAWLLILIMVTNIQQGILRDGISGWMPTFVAEVFQVESSLSILTGVALPVFGIAVTYLTAWLHRTRLKNEAVCVALFFGISVLSNLMLCLTGTKVPFLAVICLLLMNAMANGINFVYTNLAVANFEPYGKTAFVTGAINSAVYVGSAVSMYGIAYVTERFGWSATLLAWCMVGVAGFVIAAVTVPVFRNIRNSTAS